MNRLTKKQRWAVFWALMTVISVSAAVAIVGMPSAATHGDGDSNMVDPDQDYTEPTWDSVWWGYGPNAHETGKQSGWAFRSTPNDANGQGFNMEYYEYVAIHAPWADMSDCAVTDTDVAGIDRDDDNWDGDPYDPGNDDSVVQDIQNSKITEHYGYFQFAGPDDPSGRGINLNDTDAFTAGLSCFNNPDEEGWYRLTIWFNGTDYNGDKVEFLHFNEWKYFCDDAEERCSDRDQAIETLGPPPTEFNYPTGERTENYEPDTQWAHTSGPPGDDGSDDGEATPTPAQDDDGSDDGEATPTPAQDDDGAGDDGTGDDGAGDDGTDDDGAGDDGTGDDGAGDDGTGDDGAGDDGTGDDGAGDDDGAPGEDDDTPDGDGPGFGVIAAIMALLASTLLLYRRD